MLFKSTYPKILFLTLSSSVFFVGLYFGLYTYTNRVQKQVYNDSTQQFERELNNLLLLDSKPINVAIINDSNWDEFVWFMKTRDANWYNETIGNELDIYDADYMGTYDLKGDFIIRVASPQIKSIDFIPKKAMMQLNKSSLSRFYMKIPFSMVLQLSH